MSGYTDEEISELLAKPRHPGVYRFVTVEGDSEFVHRTWDGQNWHLGTNWNSLSEPNELNAARMLSKQNRVMGDMTGKVAKSREVFEA